MKFPLTTVCVVAAIGLLWMTDGKPDETKKAPTSAADSMVGKKAGQVRNDNSLKMKLVWCPPGEFTMKQSDRISEPAAKKDDNPKADAVDPKDETAPQPRMTTKITPVKVSLTQGYWLGQYEVTQSEWKEVMKTEPWKDGRLTRADPGRTREGADYPATYVSWNAAVDFCREFTAQERQAGRLPNDWEYTLPTEAQWEYACRAGTETKFSFGDDGSQLEDHAWFAQNTTMATEAYAHEVGKKKANRWGLFDMHGNVWEWCRDVYTNKLPGGRDPELRPDEKADDSDLVRRVFRGGGWNVFSAQGSSAYRIGIPASRRNDYVGFRVALSPVR